MAGVLRNMETGVELSGVIKKFKVEDADAYALFKFVVAVPWVNLFRIHFCKIEQGTLRPYGKLGKLDFNVYLGIVIHKHPDIKDSHSIFSVNGLAINKKARERFPCFPPAPHNANHGNRYKVHLHCNFSRFP